MRNKIFLIIILSIFLISFTSAVIVLPGTSNYASTDTNVTQENLYTHLNLSDGNIMAYFPMDIDARDYSINSNDGTVKEAVLTGGKYGGGYKFDGSNDFINLSTSPLYNFDETDSFTFNVWVKQDKLVSWAHILSKNKVTYFMSTHSNGRPYFSIKTNHSEYATTTSGNILPNGEWVMLTATYNGSHTKMYFNGVINGTIKVFGTFNTTAGGLILGASTGRDNFFNGSLDDVMIFNRSLSEKEVEQIYNATYPRFYPNGEQRFIDNNFGTNNTVNITIPNCQQLNGSSIYFDINGNGFSQLNSTCMYDGYNLTGDTTNTTVTLKLNSGTYSFYSPLVVGNITLNDYYIDYSIILPYINYYPIYGTRSCFAYNYLKPTGNCTR